MLTAGWGAPCHRTQPRSQGYQGHALVTLPHDQVRSTRYEALNKQKAHLGGYLSGLLINYSLIS